MLPFKLVYHRGYDLNLGEHVFPSQKFHLIAESLLREGIATDEDFLMPDFAPDEDILRVHTAEWVHKLKTGTLTRERDHEAGNSLFAGGCRSVLVCGRRLDFGWAIRITGWIWVQFGRRVSSCLSGAWRGILRDS